MILHLIQLLSADAAKVFFTFLIIVMLLMEPSIFSTLFSLCRATGLTRVLSAFGADAGGIGILLEAPLNTWF